MKIAIVVTAFPKVSETFIVNDIIGLIDLGHDVDILALQKPRDATPTQEEVSEYKLLNRTRYLNIPKQKLERLIKALLMVIRSFYLDPSALAKFLNFKKYGRHETLNNLFKIEPFLRKKYDIIHCHFGSNALKFIFLKDILDIKFVTTFHGYDISKDVKEKGNDLYCELFAKGDLFLPVSEYFKNKLLKLGCPEEKIKLRYCGVDADKFPYVDRIFDFHKRIRLLTLARLAEKKGI